MMPWDSLDKREGLVLRGAGILLIMLHNFTHWVPPVTGENEFSFEARHFRTMAGQLLDTPADAWRILFSYFGHHGVQLFVFLSAYGLTRSFLLGEPGAVPHLKRRIAAVYPAAIIAAGTFLLYNSAVAGLEQTWGRSLVPLLRQFFLVGVFTGEGFTPIGPWWFLSMIFQFYLVFPLLFRALRRFGTAGLFWMGATALLLEGFCNRPFTAATAVNLNYTVPGHLAEFCFGMWAASRGKMVAPGMWIGAAAGVFAAGQLYDWPWLLSGLAFIILSVPGLRRVARLDNRVARVLAFYGGISLPLFLMNGFLRNPLVWLAQRRAEEGAPLAWLSTVAWSLVFVGSCTLFGVAATRLERMLRQRLRE